MSLVTKTFSFLSIKPYVWFEAGVHRSRSHLAVIVFSLGAYCKRVEIDPVLRMVVVTRRYLWILLSRKRYHFDDVQRIDYPSDSSLGFLSFDYENEPTDQLDMFRVALELKSRKKVVLWTFYGEGSVVTGWSGVLLGGDSLVDLSGDQADASLGYAKVLCAMLDKSLT
ncbi:MAG: hypothetical protein ACI9R3_000191 [Verrucomicrobiales bacterium]|jgi:hypothetical protein